jgi:hypothetical protein
MPRPYSLLIIISDSLECCDIRFKWKLKVSNAKNEAPRRKRARYQIGLKSNSYLGGHVVSPQTPLPRIYPAASGRGIIKCNKSRQLRMSAMLLHSSLSIAAFILCLQIYN